MARRRRKKTAAPKAIVTLCIVVAIFVLFLSSNGSAWESIQQIWDSMAYSSPAAQNVSALIPEENTDLLFYVIDTGNSDSMVFLTPEGNSILIDAGDSDDAQRILETLDALGITSLDAVLATHPHADHIGSMSVILENIPVGTIYMTDFVMTTKTYERMIDQIELKEIPAVNVTAGYTFDIGSLHFTALNPQAKEYKDANNSSIVLRAQYGNTSFLLEGDAEIPAIQDMLMQTPELMDVDVLKVGHHGSHNATTQEFLNIVTPSLAIITCGTDNDYGHPHQQTLDLLASVNATVLRLDQKGDIAVFSDGNTIHYLTAA